MMKKLLSLLIVLSAGVALAGDKGTQEVTLDELDEITGGGVRDPKIILWDEAHKNTGVSPEVGGGATGNSATYGNNSGVNEVGMK